MTAVENANAAACPSHFGLYFVILNPISRSKNVLVSHN